MKRVSVAPDEQIKRLLMLLVPATVLLYMLDREFAHEIPAPEAGKEEQYLEYNRDEIFKSLIATEGHFRNVQETPEGTDGFLNCAVKHLADAESHADEAISHAAIVESADTSDNFKILRNQIRGLRHRLQDGEVEAVVGIEQVRQIRHNFESFNPSFDVSKCQACDVA